MGTGILQVAAGCSALIKAKIKNIFLEIAFSGIVLDIDSHLQAKCGEMQHTCIKHVVSIGKKRMNASSLK